MEHFEILDNHQEASNEVLFKKGIKVGLNKVGVIDGQQSSLPQGHTMSGILSGDIKVGSPILFEGGGNTTSIVELYKENGKSFAKTRTSIYEIASVFQGLELQNEFGTVMLPPDAKIAELRNEIIDLPFAGEENEEDYSFYINKPKLQGVLLEVNGAELFRVMNARFVVVAKVGDGHLPFYISSSGTSGKRMGDWYPFFGYNGVWIVKGGVDKSMGDMVYSEKIKQVQDTLNENLVFPAHYISIGGKFGGRTDPNSEAIEPDIIYADLSEHFKYQTLGTAQYPNDYEYTKRITGYNPERVSSTTPDGKKDPSVGIWINEIVKKLG